ncbi:hypothetical protein BGZ95_003607 [Linnemannia exigua]|uniref:RING-type domain-containing protein n=1 Tax=Linnemannia exigua TaxID=604196 RepID=A0AAD4D406_9FUNG|nr:hypothetical protein BGZ95_003607 [Linnemannia exigua]
MIRGRNPPIYTRHGYQPSILMGSSSKRHSSTRQRRPPQPQVTTTNTTTNTAATHPSSIMAQPSSTTESSYIPVWLDSRVFEQRFTFTPPPMHISSFLAQSSMIIPEPCPSQEYHQPAVTPTPSESSMETGLMDWATCPSSPISQLSRMSRIVPDLGFSPLSPSPALPMLHRVPLMTVTPVQMAFRQHLIQPELPFQGRSRSIFLSDRSMGGGVNSRVRELLHNTSIQRIRTWFLETIEPRAMEQWANQSLFEQMSRLAYTSLANRPQVPKECPICYHVEDVIKIISECNHEICWKCEADLDRFGNISCPLCRGMRLTTNYKNVQDLFATTIGIQTCDYTHRLYPQPPRGYFEKLSSSSFSQPWYEDDCGEERDSRVEHELSDRYLWQTSESFLEYLASMKDHSAKQYFQLNAARDICFKSSNDDHLREYNDKIPLTPPTSGLVLPPHRLYIALIHFCLDMLTLPNPAYFQSQRPFKQEHMILELVSLFLIPTDEFSPRHPDRIYNTGAWVEQGMLILARIRRFMKARIAQHKETTATEEGHNEMGVPSSPIPQDILYLGVARWSWIAQSMTILLAWIQLADSNPSLVPDKANSFRHSKHGSQEPEVDPRPTKRQRHRRHWMRN